MATRLAEPRDSDGRGAYARLEDRFLVLDFQAGNEDTAFEEIHRRYSGLARHVCQDILRNAEDAEEATQETMLRVYQALPRFNGRYMLQPWVARIARNVSLDVVRAHQRRPVAPLQLDHEDESAAGLDDGAPEQVVERKLEQARVTAALDALSPHHRRALVLREFEGRSHEEIAAAMHITPKQAKALIHRAKVAFRRVWDGDRRGLAAIVPILLAPFRLPEGIRRLIGSAGQAAATSGAAAAASPVVSTSVANAGERVAAAAVAIAMATTVSVGAVTLRGRLQKDEPVRHHKRQTAAVAPSPAPSLAPANDESKVVVVKPPRESAPARDAKSKHQKDGKASGDATTAVTGPVADPSVMPSPTVTEEPSPSPSPGDSTSPAPPPPAPDWGMQFSMIGKTASLTQVSSKVKGTAGDQILFNEAADGSLGSLNPIDVQARYFGSATGSDGQATIVLYLDTANGRYTYEGTGTLQALTTPDDGTTGYAFSGAYTVIDRPASDDSRLGQKLAAGGTFELDLAFWNDQATLYSVGLKLAADAGQTLPA